MNTDDDKIPNFFSYGAALVLYCMFTVAVDFRKLTFLEQQVSKNRLIRNLFCIFELIFSVCLKYIRTYLDEILL